MTRNLKALGLVLVAVIAMSAFAAAAQAHEFQSNSGNGRTVITGANEEGTTEIIEFGQGAVLDCYSELEATAPSSEQDTLTVTPHFTDCTALGEPATVDVKHCAYVLDSDTNEAGHADIDLECAEGDEITITIPDLGTTIHIPPQTDMTGGVHYTNVANGDVTLDTTVTGLDYTCTGFGCIIMGNGKDGALTGELILEGFEDGDGPLEGTAKTTPRGLTNEGSAVNIAVS